MKAELRSLILSTEYLFPPNSDPESPRSREEFETIVKAKIAYLRQQSEIIKNGLKPNIDEDLVEDLFRQNRTAVQDIKRHWFSTGVFFLFLFAPVLLFLLALVIWIINRLLN
jgi:hypothetical protein